MKRQPMSVSIKELRDLADDLDRDRLKEKKFYKRDKDGRYYIPETLEVKK